jgi:hypothetical protein
VNRKLNWFGLAGGAATIVLIIVSLFVPWWHFQVGTPSAENETPILMADISPLNTSFGGLGENSFTVPLIFAMNLVSILSMTASGIIMLIYSVLPNKSYSIKLLGFSYRKPLYSVIFFVVTLVALSFLFQSLLGFSIPLTGTANVQISQALSPGATVSMLVSAYFLWPFWLSIAVAALCIIARVYHKKIALKIETPIQPTAPVTVQTSVQQ